MSKYNESLVSTLHNAFVVCDKILNPDHITEFVENFEHENEVELNHVEICLSIREAKDRARNSLSSKAKREVRITDIVDETSYIARSEADCRSKGDLSGYETALEHGTVCFGTTVFEVL
jgi:hypothetical protein